MFLLYAFLTIFGILFGSFINALVWRTYQKKSTKNTKFLRELSILHGRSMCPNCRHKLSARDLAPIISWVALKGRCRYCGKPIGTTYPLVEALTGFLFGLSYSYFDGLEQGRWTLLIVWLFCLVIMVALAVYDLKWMTLPNSFVATLFGGSLLFAVTQSLYQKDVGLLAGSLLAGFFFSGVFYLIFFISNEQWIGGGDVKLALPLGILAGSIFNVLLVLYVASITGLLYSLAIFLRRHTPFRKMRVPFGPFLLLGTYIVFIFSDVIHQILSHILYSGL